MIFENNYRYNNLILNLCHFFKKSLLRIFLPLKCQNCIEKFILLLFKLNFWQITNGDNNLAVIYYFTYYSYG